MRGTLIQVLGIDPGKKGALVWIGSDGQPFRVFPTPLRAGEIDFLRIEAFIRTLKATATMEVAIEKQQAFGQRVAGMAKVLENYGGYLRVLRETGVTFVEVPQPTWKAAYNLLSRGRKRTKGQGTLFPGEPEGFSDRNKQNKANSLALANIYWPTAVRKFGKQWTPDAAEAALIGSLHRSNIIQRDL